MPPPNRRQHCLFVLYAVLLRGPIHHTDARRLLARLGFREHGVVSDAALLLGVPLYAKTWTLPEGIDLLALSCTPHDIAVARWRRECAQASVLQRQKLRRVRTGRRAWG